MKDENGFEQVTHFLFNPLLIILKEQVIAFLTSSLFASFLYFSIEMRLWLTSKFLDMLESMCHGNLTNYRAYKKASSSKFQARIQTHLISIMTFILFISNY